MQRRVSILKKILEGRIKAFMDGDKEKFAAEIQKEADKLAAMPFGVPLLHIVG